jgi:hypothetical protein
MPKFFFSARIAGVGILALSSCQSPSYTDDQVIKISDAYIKSKEPTLLIENPIRSVDGNDKVWLVYYLPVIPEKRPTGSDSKSTIWIEARGFVVAIDKFTKEPMFGGFQQ